ncbi:MAG: ParB/RepB/Spo0J family partition protein [Spirochaetes bacterium]|nr:ParB/RepB/Spo0J family partition protein [Spirochaetota bacterium]
MAKQALGRGLDALFNNNPLNVEEVKSKENIKLIQIDKIERNPDQPRKFINDEEIENLANSIKEKGILQPIILVQKNDKYMIVAGERRYLAARKAGLSEIPAIIKNLTDNEILEIALIENLQREDLNPIEEAYAFKNIIEKTNMTQEELSQRIGKSRVYITNSMRLLQLSFKERDKIVSGKISKGHAIALLSIENELDREILINEIEQKGLSVRETEKLVRDFLKRANKVENNKNNKLKEKDPFIKEIEEKLSYKFNTKVYINGDLTKGKVIIEYFDRNVLDKLIS